MEQEPKYAFSTDTSDLPASLVSQSRAGVQSLSGDTKQIYELFSAKQEISIDEALFGLYRMFGIQKTRNQIVATLARLCARGFIHRVAKGKYSAVRQEA